MSTNQFELPYLGGWVRASWAELGSTHLGKGAEHVLARFVLRPRVANRHLCYVTCKIHTLFTATTIQQHRVASHRKEKRQVKKPSADKLKKKWLQQRLCHYGQNNSCNLIASLFSMFWILTFSQRHHSLCKHRTTAHYTTTIIAQWISLKCNLACLLHLCFTCSCWYWRRGEWCLKLGKQADSWGD